jgi:hypothetical protein
MEPDSPKGIEGELYFIDTYVTKQNISLFKSPCKLEIFLNHEELEGHEEGTVFY